MHQPSLIREIFQLGDRRARNAITRGKRRRLHHITLLLWRINLHHHNTRPMPQPPPNLRARRDIKTHQQILDLPPTDRHFYLPHVPQHAQPPQGITGRRRRERSPLTIQPPHDHHPAAPGRLEDSRGAKDGTARPTQQFPAMSSQRARDQKHHLLLTRPDYLFRTSPSTLSSFSPQTKPHSLTVSFQGSTWTTFCIYIAAGVFIEDMLTTSPSPSSAVDLGLLLSALKEIDARQNYTSFFARKLESDIASTGVPCPVPTDLRSMAGITAAQQAWSWNMGLSRGPPYCDADGQVYTPGKYSPCYNIRSNAL